MLTRPSHDTVHKSPPQSSERLLWFALLAGPLTWSFAEIVGVSIAGRTCGTGDLPSDWQWNLLVGVFVAAAIVTATAAVVAFRLSKQYSRTARVTPSGGKAWNRIGFMAQLAFLVSALLFLNTVLFGLAPLLVDPCLKG